MTNPSVSIIIPVFNGASVLPDTLRNLEMQTFFLRDVLIVDDKSTDNSLKMINLYQKNSKFNVTIIKHKSNQGLATCYNSALEKVKSELVILLMQDCVINTTSGIHKLVTPFLSDNKIVCTCSKTINPYSIWKKYNFWQKCLMSRHVGKVLSGRNNSFCCYKTQILKELKGFDNNRFRTGGEDADMMKKIDEKGEIIDINITVYHIHNLNPNFSLTELIFKENQRAEIIGATSFFSFTWNLVELTRIYLRPLLLIGLLIPIINRVFILFIIIFCFLYTKEVYISEWKNPRIIILPFINFFLLVSTTYYFAKGLILRYQKL